LNLNELKTKELGAERWWGVIWLHLN
jgi:hypothetical protein